MDRAVCEHAQECAGCPFIHLGYPEQLLAKFERTSAAIAPYPLLRDLEIDPVTPAEPFTHYRIRAKLMVGSAAAGEGGSRPVLGLFERANGRSAASHRVVDIPSCQVLSPSLEEVAARLRLLIGAPPPETGMCLVPADAGGLLTAFDLREVIGDRPGVLVTAVLDVQAIPAEDELRRVAEIVGGLSPLVAGVAANFREPGAAQVLGSTTRVLYGSATLPDRGPSGYRLATYGSFTQAHRGQASTLEAWIASRLGGFESILDLYGGSGGLSLPLVARGLRVTLVESFPPAAECAARAAREQSLSGLVVRPGTAEGVLRELTAAGARFDAVIANPPRRGMAPTVRKAIASMSPRVIAYVSCDPDTFCRDIDHFARLGYRTTKLSPMDMIPLTDQVETVAFLEKAAVPPPPIVYDDDDLCVVEKFAHEAPGYPRTPLRDARLIWRVSIGSSGLAVWANTAYAVPRLRAALASPRAVKVHLALVRGVTSAKGAIQKRTHYRRIARVAGHSLLRVTVAEEEGGQIERDLARIGHPVVGDARHGHTATNRHFEEKYALDRPFLHCIRVAFDHPGAGARGRDPKEQVRGTDPQERARSGEAEGGRVDVSGTLPGDLVMVLGRLGVPILDITKEVMVG